MTTADRNQTTRRTALVTMAAATAIMGMGAQPVAAAANDTSSVQVREAPLTPYRYGAATPSSLSVDNTKALAALWAAAKTATKAPEIYLPPGDWVTKAGGLPFINGLGIHGAGRDATRLAVSGSSAKSLFTWAGSVRGLRMSSLTLDGRAANAHLIDFGPSGGLYNATFRDMFWNQQMPKVRVWNQDNAEFGIHLTWQDIEMQKNKDTTLAAFYIASPANANCNQMLQVRMNGLDGTSAPFFHAKSTSSTGYLTDWTFMNIMGEQNPAGLIHMDAPSGLNIINAQDQDVFNPAGYVGHIFRLGKNAAGLGPRDVTIIGSTRRGSELAAGIFETWADPTTRGLTMIGCNPLPSSARAAVSAPNIGTTYINMRLAGGTEQSRFGAPVGLPVQSTASRFPANAYGPGATMWDTSLKKPIFSDGTNWLDANGKVV